MGLFDGTNMPFSVNFRPELRATGYGIIEPIVSISFGGFADYVFGVLRDRNVPLSIIFTASPPWRCCQSASFS